MGLRFNHSCDWVTDKAIVPDIRLDELE